MLNQKILLVFSVLIIAIPLLMFPANALALNQDYKGDGNNVDLSALQFGDIILMQGVQKKADLIGDLFPGKWHHSAVYIGDGEMVEAWTDPGDRTLDVSSTHTASEAAIYRVNTTYWNKKKAVDFMLNQIGKPYDYIWLFWPGDKNKNSEYWYCSELNWAGYKHQGVDIDANPGYSWTFWYNVAPGELADDNDTYLIDYSD